MAMRMSVLMGAGWIACLLAVPAQAQSQSPSRPEQGTLLSVEAGDTACYLRMRDDAGQTRNWPAAFELCENVQARIGRRFALDWESARVAHPSCQGDTNCRRTQSVTLVARLRPLPR